MPDAQRPTYVDRKELVVRESGLGRQAVAVCGSILKGEWLLALGGIASILSGAALIFNPAVGALAVVWIIGAYAIKVIGQ